VVIKGDVVVTCHTKMTDLRGDTRAAP